MMQVVPRWEVYVVYANPPRTRVAWIDAHSISEVYQKLSSIHFEPNEQPAVVTIRQSLGATTQSSVVVSTTSANQSGGVVSTIPANQSGAIVSTIPANQSGGVVSTIPASILDEPLT